MDATLLLFFGRPAMTLRCLRGILAALSRAGARRHWIYVIDNGSSPESARAVREGVDGLLRASTAAAIRPEFLTLEMNQGFARAMNAGLRAAFRDGWHRVVAFSNDAEPGEGFYLGLPTIQRTGEASSTPVIYCPRVFHLMDRARPSYTHGILRQDGTLEHVFDPSTDEIRFPAYYPAATMVWTREAFERLDGFNERFFCYWEDVELSLRAAETGVRLVAAEQLRVHHLGRGTTSGKRAYSRHYREGAAVFTQLLLEIRGRDGLRSGPAGPWRLHRGQTPPPAPRRGS